MFSSSELTVPDAYETYHDVHHGYSPSFAATDTCGENPSRQSLLSRSQSLVPHIEWCVFNPVALVPSPRPPRQASFDFLCGNRAHLRQNSLVDDLSGIAKTPILPTSTFLRIDHLPNSHPQKADLSLGFESESSGDVLSADGGEFEIEELSTFDVQSTVSRDLFLKNTDGILSS